MKTITFYLYSNDELRVWFDVLEEYDVDWDLQTVRSEHNPDKKRYKITVHAQESEYDDLCHLAYRQYSDAHSK